ncbi:uncharacterized protein LOC107041930 [Diachasma alloeum]|uniref:uncharacterized protein LOC107041930 n=1 Tax=Diachasma alloeum TaxID=454923 RepID=UPI0007385048|nr:uncharacterized protein LOC107041930 [Diachasma alloeum]
MASKEDSANEAGQPPKDDIYENRPVAKKIIRIVTVMAYLVSVSFVAIVLSSYYIFLWHPPPGGSLSLKDPHSEYLMESPPQRPNNRAISEIIEKINHFRKNNVRRGLNRTTSLHDESKDVENLTKIINRNESYWQHADTSTDVYHSISENQLDGFLNESATKLGGLKDVPETSSEAPSTSEGQKYLNAIGTTGGANRGRDEGNGTHGEDPDEGGVVQVSTDSADGFNGTMETSSQDKRGIQEKTTTKPNTTDSLIKQKLIYSPVYKEEDQRIERLTELEASLDPLPTINPTNSEYEDISEENVEEPLDIEFDSNTLPRR